MKNKAFYLILVLVVLFVAGFLVWKPKNNNTAVQSSKSTTGADSTSSSANLDATNNLNSSSSKDLVTTPSGATSTKDNPDQSQAQYSGEGDIQSPDVAVFEVDYDGTAFTSKSTTINKGDIVIFQNNSDQDFWPMSNSSAGKILYPGFDSQKAISAGGKFEFKFLKTGTWGFIDHLNPSITGTIVVK